VNARPAGNNGKVHPYELSLELPAVHRGVRIARNVLRHFTRLWGMADREVDQLLLVVSELLANTIDHGGGGAAMTEEDLETGARMRLEFELAGARWTLRVSDQGGGDPDEVRALLAPEGLPDLEDERGRGLFLLNQMVDSIEVARSADKKGLTLTATKRHRD